MLRLFVVLGWISAALAGLSGQVPLTGPETVGKIITPAVSHFVQEVLSAASVPGLSMGVVRLSGDREPIVEYSTWGRKTEDAEHDDLTPDTLFALASCSKAFLVTSVGVLIDDYTQGRNSTPLPVGVTTLEWDTKLHRLLREEWGCSDEWAESKLSLRDAFSHLSGMPRHDYSYQPGETSADVLRRLRKLPQAYELREQWMYNNQMFMVGAHIVANLSGAPYTEFVQSRILAPLGMDSTTFSPSEAERSGKLTQTWTRGVRRIPYWFTDEVVALFAGAGGAISNAEDMTKWLAVLMNGGVDPRTKQTIVPPSVLAEMTAARAIVSGVAMGDLSIMGYGMGWFRMAYKGHDVVWHFGAIPGFSTLVAFLPSDNLGAVLFANMDEKQNDNLGILFRVIDEALGLPREATPSPSPPSVPATSTEYAPAQSMSLDLDAYAGTYEDVAYGSITLCGPQSTSTHCLGVLEDFTPFANTTNASNLSPSLLASFPRVWSTHLRLQHTTCNSFSAVFPALFSKGYGRDKSPFEFWDSQISVGRAEFVVEDGVVVGFALVTEEEAAAARAKRSGAIRDSGDAWFVKVNAA